MSQPALELRGIVKRFGPVHALRGADFTLGRGEVHALLGENGAGKSTLMHIAAGLIPPDGGAMETSGIPGFPPTPRRARRLGIALVHQHFTAVPALTVAENVALAAGWSVAPRALRRRVDGLMGRSGLSLDPTAHAGDLPVVLRQRLEILKALASEPTVLLLDEPTAALAPADADALLELARGFAGRGGSVVLITHKLEEALRAAHRVTVLRSGRVVLTGRAEEQTAIGLAAAMVGSSDDAVSVGRSGPPSQQGPVLVRCSELDVAREDGRGLAVRGASVVVAAGEIVGVAAVEGNGTRELLRALAGRLSSSHGTLQVERPVGFVPEDRTTEGLIPELDLTQNVVLGLGRDAPWLRGIRLDWTEARAHTNALIEQASIRAPSADIPAAALSGGNQQKLVVARALALDPRVIVAENPTRGLDVHAARAVWRRLHAAAGAGAGVIVYSTDLDELLSQTIRLLVVSRGQVSPVPAGATKAQVGALMLGAVGEL